MLVQLQGFRGRQVDAGAQVLYRAVARALGETEGADPSSVYKSLTGVERLNDVVLVDQTRLDAAAVESDYVIKGFDW